MSLTSGQWRKSIGPVSDRVLMKSNTPACVSRRFQLMNDDEPKVCRSEAEPLALTGRRPLKMSTYESVAIPSDRMFARHCVCLAVCCAWLKAGS